MRTELIPKHDNAKSFYRKAIIEHDDSGEIRIYSYDTIVCFIRDGKPVVRDTYSKTTLRHIKEFLKQNGFKADTKAQIESDYIGVV